MTLPTHTELAERGRKICNCRQCYEPKKHPCSRALWAARIALDVLEDMAAPDADCPCTLCNLTLDEHTPEGT